jgi:hypothetical protein
VTPEERGAKIMTRFFEADTSAVMAQTLFEIAAEETRAAVAEERARCAMLARASRFRSDFPHDLATAESIADLIETTPAP